MSICKFNQVKGFWKSMSFTRNPFKMRMVLLDFLFKEGLKCNIEDGLCYIEYEKHQYKVSFCQHNNYAECIILFDEDIDDYNSLGISDKTYIADKANTDLENHCKVYAFNNGIKINTSFYFTNKKMMLDLFGEHFAEMTETIDLTTEIVNYSIVEHKENCGRKIGFTTSCSDSKSEVKVAAKATDNK